MSHLKSYLNHWSKHGGGNLRHFRVIRRTEDIWLFSKQIHANIFKNELDLFSKYSKQLLYTKISMINQTLVHGMRLPFK